MAVPHSCAGIPMHLMLRRGLTVLAAYGLSGVGLLCMLMGVGGSLNTPGLARLLPLLWVFAWVCHARMSWAWVMDRAVPGWWPVWGTRAGVLSLLTPLFFMRSDPGDPVLGAALALIGLMCLLLSPAIALAIHLVRFHARAQ